MKDPLLAIITELRPAALDDLGLAPAIEALVARMSTVEGLSIESVVDLQGDGGRLPRELETTVYRLVQEALTNVAKHAHADRVRVAVGTAGGRVQVEVADDGRASIPPPRRTGSASPGCASASSSAAGGSSSSRRRRERRCAPCCRCQVSTRPWSRA